MGTIYNSVSYNQSNLGGTKYKGSGESKNLADILEPNGEYGDLNVIKKFNWTLTPMTPAIAEEVPYIKLREFYLTDSYLNQLFKAYGRSISTPVDIANAFLNPFILNGSTNQLYEGLYDHVNPTNFTYTFPYFTNNYLNTSNSWVAKPFFKESVALQKMIVGYGTALATGAGTAAANFLLNLLQIQLPIDPIDVAKKSKMLAERTFEISKLEEVLQIGFNSPISDMDDPAIDKPFIWSTTTPRTFNITFPLYNIITQPENTNWQANIIKNWELCHLLCYQNLYNKRNLFTGIPPVFYEIDIPGIHYSKAGYVNNLQILNVGNIRKYTLQLENGATEVNVPDAYMINMTITDFFIPSKNFMSSLCKEEKGKLTNSIFTYTEVERAYDANSPFGSNTPQPAPNQPGWFDPGNGQAPIPITPIPTPCWVAREIYGINNYKWIIFRDWLYSSNGPVWLQKIYTKYGRQFAKFISNKSMIKKLIKYLMDTVVNKYL